MLGVDVVQSSLEATVELYFTNQNFIYCTKSQLHVATYCESLATASEHHLEILPNYQPMAQPSARPSEPPQRTPVLGFRKIICALPKEARAQDETVGVTTGWPSLVSSFSTSGSQPSSNSIGEFTGKPPSGRMEKRGASIAVCSPTQTWATVSQVCKYRQSDLGTTTNQNSHCAA